MTREQIVDAMLREEPYRIFRTMQLGGDMRQLDAMESEGLISSERRYRGHRPQRNWYMTDVQWAAITRAETPPLRWWSGDPSRGYIPSEAAGSRDSSGLIRAAARATRTRGSSGSACRSSRPRSGS